MLDFLNRFFRRDESSKSMAKERLRLVLMSDRVALAPETFDAMKGEMLGVLQRYLEIDEHGLDVHFENAERRFMLLANIPVTQVKTHEQIEQERRRIAVNGNGADVTETRPRRRRRRRRAAANGSSAGISPGTPENADTIAPVEDDAHAASAGANGAMNGQRSAPSEPESGPGLPNGDENQES